MAFKLDPLPYANNALEPYFDARTMEIHHDRHHQGYVNNLNAAIANTDLDNQTILQILSNVSEHSTAVRNNAGGHYNHDLFWNILTPAGKGGEPTGELKDAIEAAFGSLEEMQAKFKAAAASRFGSGWAWVIVKEDGGLEVTSTPNQDNPLMDVAEVKGTPILGIDVWEHAYYLHYQNKRADYIDAFWNIVNWNAVAARFAAAK